MVLGRVPDGVAGATLTVTLLQDGSDVLQGVTDADGTLLAREEDVDALETDTLYVVVVAGGVLTSAGEPRPSEASYVAVVLGNALLSGEVNMTFLSALAAPRNYERHICPSRESGRAAELRRCVIVYGLSAVIASAATEMPHST